MRDDTLPHEMIPHQYIEGVEPLSDSQSADVKVVLSNVSKRYPNGKLAVNRLSFAMVEGQVTCVLGENIHLFL